MTVEKEGVGGKRVQRYPGLDSFSGPALLSNARRIGFGCHVFCVGFAI